MAKFETFKLRPELLKACRKQGFAGPTPIQSVVIPVLMKGRDAVVEAKTGSGKTLAYGLPLLDREPAQVQFPETLILAPTRELAQQVEAELLRSAGTLVRSIVALTGGGGMDKQKLRLDAGATIIVGTIGRIEELLERKMLRLDHIRTVVLDEVDELLKGGFSANLAKLLGLMPRERQTLLFSATIPSEVEQVAKQFTRDPARLRLTAARETPAELAHRVLFTTVDHRIADLAAFLHAERPYQALIFTGTRHEAEEVEEALAELELETEFLHGELSPNKRKQLIEKFRSGDLPVLVASDLAARGLDLPGVDLVVNYSLPSGVPAYLHRAGRTGRAGKPGVVLSLVIGQQHEQYEKLKPTFHFESMEVRPGGHVITRQLKSREERDLEYRKLPDRDTTDWWEKKKTMEGDAKKGDAPARKADRKFEVREESGPRGRDGHPRGAKAAGKPGAKTTGRPGAKTGGKPGARDDRKATGQQDRRPKGPRKPPRGVTGRRTEAPKGKPGRPGERSQGAPSKGAGERVLRKPPRR